MRHDPTATERTHGSESNFLWRGGEITRLEGFTDTVFAFAVTLLVVSLEVPKSFHELTEVMRAFVAFGVCFALLIVVWFNHYRFFRRYGLQDSWSIFLNCLLLFFVLFYVYPLKFLFFAMFTGGGQIEAQNARTLFVIYGAGYAAVFLTHALLYLHAWSKRDALALNEIERLRTRQGLIDHIAMVVIGMSSAVLAYTLPSKLVGLARMVLFQRGGLFHGRWQGFRKAGVDLLSKKRPTSVPVEAGR
jgi:uncharacterized membrane protein